MLHDLILYTPMYITLVWALILLNSSPKANRAKFFLGIFMFTTFMLFLSHSVYYNKMQDIYIYFDLMFIFASLTVYPLYFWYIKLLTKETKFHVKNILTLIPAILILIASIITYLLMSPEQRNIYIDKYLFNNLYIEDASILIRIQQILSYILRIIYPAQIIYFLLASNNLIHQYNTKIASFYSNLEDKTIGWAKLILYSFAGISIVSVAFNFLGRCYFIQSDLLLLIPSGSFSILLFVFGYLGNLQDHTVADYEKDKKPTHQESIENQNHKRIKKELVKLFKTNHIYKQTDLKITNVAQMLNTNRTYVSNIINKEFSCSFSEFVNQYRINSAKNILANNESNTLSLEYIA